MATNLSPTERVRLNVALQRVCLAAGIDPAGAKLVRFTMNAVYRIPVAGVVVRMTAGPHAPALVRRVVTVAAVFADLGLPTTRLAPGVHQPVDIAGWSASVWTLLPQPPSHRFTPTDLALPLRIIHALDAPPCALPQWDIVGKARHRLAQVAVLDAAARRQLHDWATTQVGMSLDTIVSRLNQRCDDLETALADVEWTLRCSVVHGDAHAGNLLYTPDGRVVIGDLDSVAFGQPEWDLIPAAHGVARFGDDPGQYQAFAEAYGVDITALPAWDVLSQVRELQLLTSVIASLPGRPDVAHELAHRLRTGLVGDPSATWHRFR